MKYQKFNAMFLAAVSALVLFAGTVVSYAGDKLQNMESSGINREPASWGEGGLSDNALPSMSSLVVRNAMDDISALSNQRELFNGSSFQVASIDSGQVPSNNDNDCQGHDDCFGGGAVMSVPVCP